MKVLFEHIRFINWLSQRISPVGLSYMPIECGFIDNSRRGKLIRIVNKVVWHTYMVHCMLKTIWLKIGKSWFFSISYCLPISYYLR